MKRRMVWWLGAASHLPSTKKSNPNVAKSNFPDVWSSLGPPDFANMFKRPADNPRCQTKTHMREVPLKVAGNMDPSLGICQVAKPFSQICKILDELGLGFRVSDLGLNLPK